ncbi:MAG: SH3 domain-containing protein [Bacteroidota bacterium]
MREFFILGLLLCNIGFAQDLKLLSPDYSFEPHTVYLLFGDQVKLRSGPGTDTDVLDLLAIGTAVNILEKMPQTQFFKGLKSHWYKVKAEQQEGYILGGLISLDHVSLGDAIFVIGLNKKGEELAVEVRTIRQKDAGAYEELSVSLPTYSFELKGEAVKGIEGVNNALVVDFFAEACGVNSGGTYLFDTGEELIEAFSFIQASDAGVYSIEETLIFPNAPEGREGKILFTSKTQELLDEETNWISTKWIERELQWDGYKIVPDLRAEE